MDIYPATQNNFSAALALLRKNNLPADDITDTTHLFVLTDNDEVVGTVALESAGKSGLLRSLCVADEARNNGAGQRLVNFIERYAQQNGVHDLYLLTTTADKYFGKKGYTRIDRTAVPAEIKNTSEFASVCPSTAVVMKKTLA